jgi:hypothetical protein
MQKVEEVKGDGREKDQSKEKSSIKSENRDDKL